MSKDSTDDARGTSEPVLIARNVTKRYPLFNSPGHRLSTALFGRFMKRPTEYSALEDVSFELARGDALAVVGRNGAGKSTLLQILSGVLEPTSGSVSAPRRVAGLLELGSGFNPEFSGRENIYVNAAILGLTRAEISARLDAIVDFADIGDYIDQPVKTYSSGMFLRLAFSVAVNVEPELLLVDEALTVGDVFFQQKCYARLNKMRLNGTSVLLVTHSMADAAEFCNRGIVLSQGRIVFAGRSKEAVEYYFHHESHTPTGRRRVATAELAPLSTETEAPYPEREESIDLSTHKQFGDGGVVALRMLVTDKDDEPRRVFTQGGIMRIYTDYKVDKPIDVPLAGVQILNAKGILVHGKNSLQYSEAPPKGLAAGTIMRCVQDIELGLDTGEYTLDVGVADVEDSLFERRHQLSPSEIHPHIRLLCHLSGVVRISIVHAAERYPSPASHYGIADLPGDQRIAVLACADHELSTASAQA
ncbi:ABC transporter ATP-binding protein [Pararobbsia alpina]|uniref:Vitamin B12 import ATP-binding protein BtuD n=1 Tax=Pararobbsia alpina TaxID=621374 RepID=A0A6S7BMI7_9BURK|nr:ABC transporter ATP-binding protein [Pararobbsia alpina]CAB3804066.1 Vitamin B12 import ATP-binding protein BtuD [Pararobbsia alpina]